MTDAALSNPSTLRAAGPAAPAPMDDRLKPLKIQPLRALKAFRRLMRDKEDTAQVFEIMMALNGKSTQRGYRRLMSTISGGRLAYERMEMAAMLSDRASIAAFAPHTVGGAYRRFVHDEGLSAEGLIEESRKPRGAAATDIPHPVAWFGRRIRDTHDLWHVLTGYGRDGLGELCLVAFSYAQTRSLGWAFIAVGGVLQAYSLGYGPQTARAVWQAYRHGQKAAWLPGQDFAALLSERLEAARARLNIAVPTAYLAVPEDLRRDPLRMAPTAAAA
jgi:ubiquinone biosynthesis protein COQ4